jgi:hypothetical protein
MKWLCAVEGAQNVYTFLQITYFTQSKKLSKTEEFSLFLDVNNSEIVVRGVGGITGKSQNVRLSSPLKTNQRFGRTSCNHSSCLLGLFFNPEDGGDMFLRDVD